MFFHNQYIQQPKLPSGLGYEAAGVVVAVGPEVDKNWMGKTAAVIPGFSMSDYGMVGEEVIAPAAMLGEYPAKLSAAEGAAIWMQYLTAYGALIPIAHLGKGDFVVITAASSSVGLAAIEIAKSEGASSIATTRKSNKKAELRSLGADHVIATEEEDLVARVNEITGGKGARVIFDPVAGPFVEKLAEAAAPGGIIFQYGLLSMEPTPFPLLRRSLRGSAFAATRSRRSSPIRRSSRWRRSISTTGWRMDGSVRRSRRNFRLRRRSRPTDISSRMRRWEKL
jgi:NADPH:quinone reductase-like Zn-dependent oxidoreductase